MEIGDGSLVVGFDDGIHGGRVDDGGDRVG